MKAQYEKNPELVTDFLNHSYDAVRTQKTLTENPDFDRDWYALHFIKKWNFHPMN